MKKISTLLISSLFLASTAFAATQAPKSVSDVIKSPLFATIAADVELPEWIKQGGVESSIQQVNIKGETFYVMSACKPHDCPTEQIALLFNPKAEKLAALYKDYDVESNTETLTWLNIDDDLSIDGKTVLFAKLTGSVDNHPDAFNF